ncbi:MAG: AsmA family protein, partial [Kiloniellaceae bacterium]
MTRRRRSRLKWVLGTLAVLGAATVAAGYAILANMDLGDLRAAVETQARAVTGRDLKIAGAVDLDVSLTPAIAIQDVTFGNAPWGTYPEMVSVRRIEVEVALLPLLTGEVRIRRLIVKEPTILLETSRAGQGNWVLFEPEDQDGAAGASDAGIPTFRKVEIQDARVLFRDGRTGAEYDVRIAELLATTTEAGGAIAQRVRGSYGGHDFAAEGSVGTREQLLGGGAIPLEAMRLGCEATA